MHSIAGKAVCFGEAMKPEFREYQKRIVENARALAGELQRLGQRIVSGGTDNHLLLVDVGAKGITGRDAQTALERVGIVTNKNTIPYDERSPMVGSGVRLGTPAVTSRGLGPDDMRRVARLIVRILDNMEDEKVATEVRREVQEVASALGVPGVTDRMTAGS
jgi:glycine hydroxymethyltransferase